ncbi:MAG: gamma-glutamyltransferase [Parvibaculaceae bacterium]
MRLKFVRTAPRGTIRPSSFLRRLALPLLLSAGLAGCGGLFGDDGPDTSRPVGAVVGPDRNERGLTGVGRVSAAAELEALAGGFVMADEPQAALVARDVLERGGSAADAATALYFTLSVTQPAAAGLGGGGICLVHDRIERKTVSVEFLPRRAAAGGPVAIPGNVRGFALLQARYGRRTWSSLLAPAERMAAIGTQVSRAMAESLARDPEVLRRNAVLARSFTVNGRVVRELDNATQIELASTLGLVRSRGVGALYGGDGARTFSEAIADAGGRVSIDDLRNYRPVVKDAMGVTTDWGVLRLPSEDVGAGAFAKAVWDGLQSIPAGDGAAATRLADQTARQLGAPADLPDNMGSTGFVVASAQGDAVACAVTMNGHFGTGRTASGMGVVLASSPEAPVQGLAPAFLAPVLATRANDNALLFAGASGGSPAAVSAVQQVARQTLGGSTKVSAALGSATPGTGTLVNALVCPAGLPFGFPSCEFGVDPDGAGVGVEAIGQ